MSVVFRLSSDLLLTPDPGIQADHASNPGARVDPVTGTVYLYYEFRIVSSLPA
jgi:hypothetical protein